MVLLNLVFLGVSVYLARKRYLEKRFGWCYFNICLAIVWLMFLLRDLS